jgi:hypothetical protein
MNQATYDVPKGLPVPYAKNFGETEDVGRDGTRSRKPAHCCISSLSLQEANQILTDTEGPGGRFLDDGSTFGVYSRLNLYAASLAAKTLAEHKVAAGK